MGFRQPFAAAGIAPSCRYASGVADPEKAREARLRRMAQRQGLALRKSRRRDRKAPGYGRYRVVEATTDELVMPSQSESGFDLSLDDVENMLTGDRPWTVGGARTETAG